MTLGELLDEVIRQGGIRQSRVHDVRYSVRKFSRLLSHPDPAECPESAYLIPERERNRLVEESLAGSSVHLIRNTKNNLSFLFRRAMAMDILPDPAEGRVAAGITDAVKKFMGTPPARFPRRSVAALRKPYGLKLRDWPSPLREQYEEWRRWMTEHYHETGGRRTPTRRAALADKTSKFEAFFGYLANVRNLQSLDFSMIVDIEPPTPLPRPSLYGQYREDPNVGLLQEYVFWLVRKRIRRPSRQAIVVLMTAGVVARHYFPEKGSPADVRHFAAVANAINEFRQSLKKPDPAFPPEESEVSFDDLLKAARDEFLEAERLASREPALRLAAAVGRALALMLMLHFPLRNRNLRQAQIGKNLYQDEGGSWHLRFTAADLAAGAVQEGRKRFDKFLPQPVVEVLERYLDSWRPLLLVKGGTDSPEVPGTSGIDPDPSGYLFLTARGRPFDAVGFSRFIETATYRRLGVRFNTHTLRHLVATEYLKQGMGYEQVAELLHTNIQTIIKSYKHLIEDPPEKPEPHVRHTYHDLKNGK